MPYTRRITPKIFAYGATEIIIEGDFLPCIEHKTSKFSPAALYSAVLGRKGAPQARKFCVFGPLNSDLQGGNGPPQAKKFQNLGLTTS